MPEGGSCCCPGQGQRAAGGRPASWALPRPSPTLARSMGHASRSRSMRRGCRRRSRPRRAARPWRADGGLRCVASPGRDQRFRRSGFLTTKSSSPGRWLSCAASARPGGGYRTVAASPACWPRSGTSRSDQHFITRSSHFPGSQLRSVTDLGIPPATEAISMPDCSPGSKPRSVLIAPEPGGGLGRGPGCDLVAFGERPDRLDARAGRRRPGRPRAHDRPGGSV